MYLPTHFSFQARQERLQVGGACKSGASASRERLQERLHAGSAFKSGTPSSRERLYVGMNNSTPHVFNAASFNQTEKKKSFFDFKLGDVFQYLFHHVYTLQTYLFISVKSQH
jgi:hypothetical protein